MSRLTQLLVAVFVACAHAAKPLGHEVCVASCYYSLLKIKYAAVNPKAEAACTNPLRVESTYYCMKLHCEEDDISPGIDWWAATCKNSTKIVTQKAYKSTSSNATDSYLASLPTVKQNQKNVLDTPAVPSADNWEVVYRTVYTYSAMRDYHNAVRWIPYGFWAIVLLAGMLSRAWSFIPSKRFDTPISNDEAASNRSGIPEKLRRLVKYDLLLSPTVTYRHHQPWGWFTVPTRLQSLTILSYIALHIILSAVHYPIYDESYYYSSRRVQALRYFSDRLGGLMSSTLPWLFLFGGRSNPFSLLTGWSYRSFSLFHRWIAIVLLVEALIHGIAFSAFYVNDKGWETYRENLKSDEKFVFGIMATTSLGLAAGFAFSEIRKRAYELFKATHVILAVIFLAAIYEHVKDQFSGVYNVWVWVCVAVWGFDYVCRIARILHMNYKSLIGDNTPAIASYNEETGMIRLQVYPSTTSKGQTPGQYYFVYLGGFRFWQSHPFSLAGRSIEESAPLPQIHNSEKKSPTMSSQVIESENHSGKSYLTFLIRPRDGMTRHLRAIVAKKNASARLRVILEGPYGSSVDISRFKDVLFVAGGSGITAILPYLRRIFEDRENGVHIPNTKLVWAVRHEGFARDVLANDLQATEASPSAEAKLSLQFFVSSESDGSETPSSANTYGHYLPDTRFRHGRPNVESIVQGFIDGAQSPMAVFVCGPGKMADDTRSAVIKHGKRSFKSVELFEEMYGW